MTIMIHFHQSHYRDFKAFYLTYVTKHLAKEFPELVSYTRFNELMQRVLVPLCIYLRCHFGHSTGIAFIDSTKLEVCHNKRIKRNRVFKEFAKVGKSTMGWFYGFKLHIIVNELGEFLSVKVTPGNVDDRAPVRDMTRNIAGKLFGDKGYISAPLCEELLNRDLTANYLDS